MKQVIMILCCVFAFACNNPEDNANMHTDSAGKKTYNESDVINSNPGSMDAGDETGKGLDTSNFPADSMSGNRPINDTSRKQ